MVRRRSTGAPLTLKRQWLTSSCSKGKQPRRVPPIPSCDMDAGHLEKASEMGYYHTFDIAQGVTHDSRRPKYCSPCRRRWLIEAYSEHKSHTNSIMRVQSGISEARYFVTISIWASVKVDKLGASEESPSSFIAYNRYEQLVMLITVIKTTKDRKFVKSWLNSLIRLHLIKDYPHFIWNARINLRKITVLTIGDTGHCPNRKGGATRSHARTAPRRLHKLP